jgi:predicted nucleotidyltransferase
MPEPAATAHATSASPPEGQPCQETARLYLIIREILEIALRTRYTDEEETMRADVSTIARKFGVVLALQFGSSVTGKTHERSDVDIAVLLERPDISFQEHADLLDDLHQLFPGKEVDLAMINHADPLFLKKIIDDCQILFGSAQRLQRLRIYAFKRYQDHRKYFEMERQYAAKYVASASPAE